MNTITHFHICGGAGGAALGFQRGRAQVGTAKARAVCLGGIDNDAAACRDFKRLVGVEQLCRDLFDREMYIAFHGKEPPEDWCEVTIDDMRAAAQHQAPDIVVVSAPCKGYSRLLSEKKSDTPRYQALNKLVLRCIHLALCAWEDDPPSLFLIENVPAIATRGRGLLDRVQSLFAQASYAARETTHCAGEMGGLGQRRRRFLMVARHTKKVPALLYEPAKRPLRSIGQVIGEMPPPSSQAGGPMHRLPRLDRKTWARLALIPAGKDWRALRGLDLGAFRIESYGSHHGKMRVEDWAAQAHTVTGADRVGSGAPSIADPKWGNYQAYGVKRLDEVASNITAQAEPGSGPFSIADRNWGGGSYGVLRLEQTASTVTGEAAVSTGAFSVADSRGGYYSNILRLVPWDSSSGCVTGNYRPSSGGLSVADPRAHWANSGHYGVKRWNDQASCVTGAASCDNGPNSVADPRFMMQLDVPIIVALDETWHRPLTILEMAALQGFDWQDAEGTPLELDGPARARWQERIGNAIPPPAAEAIAGEMMRTILMSRLGQTFCLSATDRWVRPVALALTVDGREIEV